MTVITNTVPVTLESMSVDDWLKPIDDLIDARYHDLGEEGIYEVTYLNNKIRYGQLKYTGPKIVIEAGGESRAIEEWLALDNYLPSGWAKKVVKLHG